MNKVAYGCVIRSTYGLSCAHEIVELMMEGRAIPLSFVHPHWAKLNLVQTASSDDVSSLLTIDLEIESIYNIFHLEPTTVKTVLK